ncbi:MAG: hypothetical protein ABSH56_02355 [Bryobacteraceae bacterium]
MNTGVGGTAALTVKFTPLEVPPLGFNTDTAAVPAEAIRLAGTEAVDWVALTKVVESAAPFHCTVDPPTNPDPFTVSVKALLPAVAVEGLKLAIVGPGLIVKGAPAEVAPPLLITLIVAVPAAAIRLLLTVAVNCVALTKVVGSAEPFHCTVAAAANPLPITVSVRPEAPAAAELGFRLLTVGREGLIVNGAPAEVVPPQLTAMAAVPTEAIRLLLTAAVNCVALIKVVGSAAPFHSNTAPEGNPLPITVSVNAAPPVVAALGLRLLIVSALMVKLTPLEAPSPGFASDTVAVPAEASRLAGTAAVNCVALTNVVARAVPFHCTVHPLTNPDPFTVSVKAFPPAVADEGLNVPSIGPGLIVKVAPEDVTPPLATLIVAIPGKAIRLPLTVANNSPALATIVGNAIPFDCTTAPEANPLPFTVSVKPFPPAVADGGLKLLIIGPGLIVKVAPEGVTPPLATLIVGVPGKAIRPAGTAAVNCVALTNVVGSAVPFHCNIAPAANPLPFTVSVKAFPPAVADEGLNVPIIGPGLIVKVAPEDVTPPLATLIVMFPGEAIRLLFTVTNNAATLTPIVGTATPFHCTTAPEANPLPLTVSVKPRPPAVADEGTKLPIIGPGLIVKVAPEDVTPPLVTVIVVVPAEAVRLAGTVAVSCVALMKVVGSAVPFHRTTAPEANPLPFTVSVKPLTPAVADEGVKPPITGLIVKVAPKDVTPPTAKAESGRTVMVVVPAVAIRLAGTAAVNCVALTNVVRSTVPFHSNIAPAANPLPFTVNVNAAPPAVAELGLRLLMAGRGLIVNEAPADAAPLLPTVTVAVPGEAIRLLLTVAVNLVEFMNVLGRAAPFHCTTEPSANPLPLTVRMKADPPAISLLGLSEAIPAGARIVSGSVELAVSLSESVTVNCGL